MKIAIISDTHLGDPKSVMANKNGVGTRYEKFRSIIKDNLATEIDYLILLGDIMDFAVSSYQEAYDAGKRFFIQLKHDKVAKQIIYVPGNHDFDLWHTIEYEVNVINKIMNFKPVELFRFSVPAIIDDRANSRTRGFTLRNVTVKDIPNKPKYAGLFLDHITSQDTGETTVFNFAYPNIYMVTDNESILITHGQYLEQYWSMTGDLAIKVFGKDLDIKDKSHLDLKEAVGINFPLSQLSSSGSGQAGPLTERIQAIEHMVYDKKYKDLETYLDQAIQILKSQGGFFFKFLLWLINVKKKVIKAVTKMQKTQYNEEFTQKDEVRHRFMDFYIASIKEIDALKNDAVHIDIPYPTKVIFGHTHCPISWGFAGKPNDKPLHTPDGKPILLYNCGGWLAKKTESGQEEFKGGEIFLYETGKEIFSVRVL
jgi:hypothetical protein